MYNNYLWTQLANIVWRVESRNREEFKAFSKINIKGYSLLTKGAVFVEGVQNGPSQNVSLWYVGYFEVKTVETLQAQEKLLPLPTLPRRI